MDLMIVQIIVFFQTCFKIVTGEMTGFVTGGVEVPIEMYPHVAQLTLNHHIVCGGSIIRPRIILTAAHCVVDLPPGVLYSVYVGSSRALKGDQYMACKYIGHEKYNVNNREYYYFDIALILLEKDIKFNSRVQSVPIATTSKWMNQKYRMTIAGFGITHYLGGSSPKLKATKMTYVSPAICNYTQTNDQVPMYLPKHMFCMIGKSWTGDCPGDSGSGILWKGQIVGVVSTGREESCGSDIMPSMYTNVPYFKDWVDTNSKDLESIPPASCANLVSKLGL